MADSLLQNPTYFPKWLHVLRPKGGELGEDEERDEWQGTVQAIRQENTAMMKRVQSVISSSQKKVGEGTWSRDVNGLTIGAPPPLSLDERPAGQFGEAHGRPHGGPGRATRVQV